MGNELSEELRQFIKEYITSLEQLEVLLLLHSAPDRSWMIEDVFKVIQSNPRSVAERLKNLTSLGILVTDGAANPTFRFRPSSEELAKRTSELAKAYSFSKYRIIEMIFSTKRDQAQKFADSFKIRREE